MAREEWLPDSELFPCANCEKQYTNPLLHIISINIGAIDQRAAKQRLGMGMMLGSHALAAIMGSYPDGIVRVNTDPEGMSKVLLCTDCFCGDINLAVLREKVTKWKEERALKAKTG